MKWRMRFLIGGILVWGALSEQVAQAEERPPVLALPSSPEELIEYCRNDSSLTNFARHGEVLTGGMQIMLLGTDVPIADAPNVKWAKPYYRGKVKILAFLELPQYGQMSAIYRCLDSELSIVQMPPGTWFAAQREELYQGYSAEVARKALAKPYDVILLFSGLQTGPQHLPADIQAAILEKVKQGTGLVINGSYEVGGGHPVAFWPEKTPFAEASLVKPVAGRVRLNSQAFSILDPEVLAGVPFQLFPPVFVLPVSPLPGAKVVVSGGKTPPTWKYNHLPEPLPEIPSEGTDTPLVVVGKVGEGKVVSTAWATNYGFPVVDLNDRHYGIERYEEYFAAMVAKLVLWAANKPSEVSLKPVVSSRDAAPENAEVTVVVIDQSEEEMTLKVEAVVRDWHFEEVWRGTKTVAAEHGPQRIVFRMPTLPAGRYVFDAIARDRSGASVNWASAEITTSATEKLELRIEKESFRRDEKVIITGTASGLSKGEHQVELKITDSLGRLLREQRLTPEADGTFKIRQSLEDAVVSIHRVQGTLYKGNQARARAETQYYSPVFGWDDFHNILWGDEENVELLRDWAGVDTFLGAGWPGHEPFARAGAKRGLNLLWTNVAVQSPEQTQQEPDKTEIAYDEQVRWTCDWLNRYGAIGVCFQDERHSFKDPQPNEECLRRFREWLKAQYGDIERLNASWESNFKGWDEVKPLLTEEFKSDRMNLAPWLDFRLFVSSLTIDIDARHAATIRKATTPDLYIGIEGVFGLGGHIVPYSGFDYAEHARRCFSMIMPYDGEVNSVTNLARSFCPGPLSTWDGYSAPKWQYYGKPWWGALHGYWAMSWFCSRTFATSTGCLFPQAQWVEEATRKLRHGAGKLLMTSKLESDPIVFLYSQPSIYAAYVAGRWINPKNLHLMNRPSTQWGRENLQRLINEFCLQYSYVAEKEIEAGALNGKKLLVLPDVMCMSKKTAEAIEKFVQEGGVVLADLCPALWDEHGRPMKPGYLDKLFGVTRDRFEYGTRPADWLVGTTKSDPEFQIGNEWFIGEYYEKSLKADGGTALGVHIFDDYDVPAFVLNRTGKGATVLMNFLETNYQRFPEGRQRVFMRALLNLAKIERPIQVADENGGQLYQYDVTQFRDGENLYVGVYRMTTSSSLNPEWVTVRLPKSGHLYEVKSEKYLGVGKDARVSLLAAGSALIAILPYEVQGVSATVTSGFSGEPIKVAASVKTGGKPGRHILHVEVIDPQGRLYRAYSRNVETKNGEWQGEFRSAINDPKGRWKVTVKEVVSGKVAETSFRLQ